MSVRRTILIERYTCSFDGVTLDWCAREYVQHDDESRTTRVLHTAPTRREVADWLEAQRGVPESVRVAAAALSERTAERIFAEEAPMIRSPSGATLTCPECGTQYDAHGVDQEDVIPPLGDGCDYCAGKETA